MDYISLTAFSLYFIFMLMVGYLAYKKSNDFSDYVLGGRELGPVVGGISTGASDMSGWLLLAFPGAVYATGLSGGLWMAIGLTIGFYLNWKYVGNKVRKYTIVSGDAQTLPEFLANRTRDTSKIIKVVSAVFITGFFTFYVSSGLVAGGLLFEQTFGVSYTVGVLLIAGVVLIYTSTGGFFAVTWTDFVQGIIMLVAVVLVPAVTFFALGGWDNVISGVDQVSPDRLNAFSGITQLGIISALFWGILGYFGQPHVILRFMAFNSSRDITLGRAVYTSWNVIAMYGAVLIGVVGTAYFGSNRLDNPESVFIQLTHTLFHPIIASILLVALLAAVMSTVSTQLLVSATSLTEDLYKGLFRKQAKEKELFWIIRGSILLVITFATLVGLDPNSSVLGLVGYAWAGFGAAFGPALLFSLFWKDTTKNGVLAGIITGGITVVLWSMMTDNGIIPFELYELIPGFLFSSLAILMFSKVGSAPTADMRHEFEMAKRG
ncbi:sodium/proline symporter PutP [Salinicoccus roseus]|uniref:Sodium/proline symporter n=1 Tax=Salinicoccus roseus TaxID=45670 RepID=A0A0C2E6A0_9STAP|nr:sodium/proline symporter PutP [Salinicoccus roseus]KIH70822.1 proline:sodium symporter PutP [Salinicoccus roseus]MDB0580467.1 sodium/proline symporter PutP [Salinicoccus roseus]